VYEALVAKHVVDGCSWLDVGGGRAIFPENPSLARDLVERCALVAAVDPSSNVSQNEFVHQRTQCSLEQYDPGYQFDLATMRMVVEHVQDPETFVATLSHLVRPGGVVILFTANRWAPIALLSRCSRSACTIRSSLSSGVGMKRTPFLFNTK
jgi:2-polyprenyl-3-methyl-5-hydroxy-6-metoxy-1,4-benzoquinol methylase